MSWSLRQSSWLRQRTLSSEGGDFVGLLAHPQKPVGVLALTQEGQITHWWQARGGAGSKSWGQAPAQTRGWGQHEGSQRLAIFGAFGLQVWSTARGEALGLGARANGGIDAAVFSADGSLYAGGRDGCWRGWPAAVVDSLTSANAALVVPAHQKPLRALAIHPRADCLVSAGGDHRLRVWELPGGEILNRAEG